jgi:hypothetical protein
MDRTLTPAGDELLLLAFAYWPGCVVKATRDQLIAAIHALSERLEFRSLFINYGFGDDGLAPDNAALRSGLNDMTCAGLISAGADGCEIALNSQAIRARYQHRMGDRFEGCESMMIVFASALERRLACLP